MPTGLAFLAWPARKRLYNTHVMRPAEIEAQISKRPFTPIKLCMSDGSSYDVHHPEMVIVSRTVIAIAEHTPRTRTPERVLLCDPVHIIRIEPLDGRPPRRGRAK